MRHGEKGVYTDCAGLADLGRRVGGALDLAWLRLLPCHTLVARTRQPAVRQRGLAGLAQRRRSLTTATDL